MADLVLATRGSALAMAQTRAVARALEVHHPGIEVEPLIVTTGGDLDRTTPVTELTELGAFVRAVQSVVLSGGADAAVHSCKDLPVEGPDGLTAVYPARAEPWDVMSGATVSDLGDGAKVGTGSPRRSAQLLALRPDLAVTGIRGNVDTRLRMVDEGRYDAVVLAEAGLRRLERGDAVSQRFSVDEMVPAAAQGALAVEHAAGGPAQALLALLDDPATRRAVGVEREVLALTRLGCRGALGVYAEPGDDGSTTVTGFIDVGDGPARATVTGRDADVATALCHALGIPLDRPAHSGAGGAGR